MKLVELRKHHRAGISGIFKMMKDELSTEHNFPNRLMLLLENEEVKKVMHWLPGGETFAISRPDLFDELVLKKHFNSIKFESFIVRLRSK